MSPQGLRNLPPAAVVLLFGLIFRATRLAIDIPFDRQRRPSGSTDQAYQLPGTRIGARMSEDRRAGSATATSMRERVFAAGE
jgi:hypothetical protein